MGGHGAPAPVPAATPGRHIAQLGEHLAHRIPAGSDPPSLETTGGRVELPDAGDCVRRAAPGALARAPSARDEAAPRRREDVVVRHVARLAWRGPPVATWG